MEVFVTKHEKQEMAAREEAMQKRILDTEVLMHQVDILAHIVADESYDVAPSWLKTELVIWLAEVLAEDEYQNEPDPYEGMYPEEDIWTDTAERFYREANGFVK